MRHDNHHRSSSVSFLVGDHGKCSMAVIITASYAQRETMVYCLMTETSLHDVLDVSCGRQWSMAEWRRHHRAMCSTWNNGLLPHDRDITARCARRLVWKTMVYSGMTETSLCDAIDVSCGRLWCICRGVNVSERDSRVCCGLENTSTFTDENINGQRYCRNSSSPVLDTCRFSCLSGWLEMWILFITGAQTLMSYTRIIVIYIMFRFVILSAERSTSLADKSWCLKCVAPADVLNGQF